MKETTSSRIPFALVVFYPLLCACSPQFLRATSIKHHDRGLTLIFGSDGQVSLLGFDGGIATQPLGVTPVLTTGSTGALTLGTHFPSSESTPVSPVPNLEATVASLTSTSFFTPTSTTTSAASSLPSPSHNLSSTATDTDTNIPSIPTINYPTPTPTAVSNPKDHGVGAPFYLAIVLASISFVGCVAALIAWWIRSRARKHDLELNDPWHHRDSISNADSPSTDEFEKGAHTNTETQTRPYHLPASIVRRSSSNLLAVPHTIPTLEAGTSQQYIPRNALVAGRYPSLRPRNSSSPPNFHQNVPSSQTTNLYSRPGAGRLQTGLSVQESTHTLGRLRVANRVPGDVTSGDEGGMNISRLQTSATLSPGTSTGGPNAAPVGAAASQGSNFDRSDRPVQEGDVPLEPPGPATLSWGRRTDTVAALRRSRRRTPETTVQTYKNARYGGYWYPTMDGGPSGTMWQSPAVIQREETDRVFARPPPDPLGWTNTLKSSFWQAVDAMTGNRPLDPEPREGNVGSGSKFTPAPHRVASRRSSVSPTTSSSLLDTRTARSQEAEAEYGLTLPEKSVAAQGMPQNSTHSRSGSSLTGTNESGVPHISEDTVGRVDSLIPKVSHLNRDLNVNINQPYSDSLRTDIGSLYSTDSAAARANLRKYGYGDSIPSSWSALGESRESQLDLDRTYLPLPRPIPSADPGPLSITPSQLTLESYLQSGSVSTRTHTPMHSKSDVVGSDDSTLRSGKDMNTASYMETTTGSMYSMSRDGTIQSGRSTISLGTIPLQASSTTSSMLSRKKGVTSRPKRPRPPPRAPSTASSVQSIGSRLSIRDVAVKRALLERRKKVKGAGNLRDREDNLMRSRDGSGTNSRQNLS